MGDVQREPLTSTGQSTYSKRTAGVCSLFVILTFSVFDRFQLFDCFFSSVPQSCKTKERKNELIKICLEDSWLLGSSAIRGI